MYSHILVPISFWGDRDSKTALAIAEKLRDADAGITLLHVIEEVPGYIAGYMPSGFHTEAKQRAAARLSEMSGGHDNVNTVVIDGHSARSILDFARQHDVDCIVIASHRPGMQDLLLGSTATHVVRHADCAVHVVR